MAQVVIENDIEFARPDGQALLLDLYRPEGSAEVPVVVHLHGGGWARGERTMGAATRLEVLASRGIAVASVDYRLAPSAVFPAAVLDVRAAVAFLRRTGERWNLATERIGAWGASAGGHLALLAAYAGDLAPAGGIEGGPNAEDPSARIDAVVNWFAASDLVALMARSPLERMTRPAGPESLLLGAGDGSPPVDAARQASPLRHVRADGPPVLTLHGDRDQLIPVDQSQRLHAALSAVGVDSTLMILGGAGHEDPAFERPEVLALMAEWLRRRLG